MRLSVVFFAVVLVLGCARTPEEIQAKIDQLKTQETQMKFIIKGLECQRNTMASKCDSLKQLREEVRALEITKNGGEVEYVLECRLSQDRSNMLDQGNMKDYLNAVDFNMTVDRRTYNHYKKDDEFFRRGRKGSAVVEGSYSDWLITVIGKHINTL